MYLSYSCAPCCMLVVSSPPENDSFRKDFCFAVVSFFFFLSPCNLRAPSADRREILHDAPKYVRFYNPGLKFWVSLPKKILKAENMQNFARFWSNSKSGGQFLRNG